MLHTLLRGEHLGADRGQRARCAHDRTFDGGPGPPPLGTPAEFVQRPAGRRERPYDVPGAPGATAPNGVDLRQSCRDPGGERRLGVPDIEEYQEPTATVVATSKGERRLLFAAPGRAIWRDLHALTVMKHAGESGAAAPWILRSHQDPLSPKPLDLWTGALITDGKAKIIDAVESVFHLESRLFTEVGRGIYEQGVAYALRRFANLRDAVRAYGKALNRRKLRSPLPSATTGMRSTPRATRC